jgi:RNA polymerase sigma-70 factor (ECF subfamily)
MGPTQPPSRPPAEPGPDRDDADLAQLARSGDLDAFGRLVDRHHRAIYRLAAASLGNEPDAEDATQETFIQAYESLGRYDARREFWPWLRGIAINVCRQHLRRQARKQSRQVSLASADEVPDRAGTVDTEGAVLAALRELDDGYRLPLGLFYIEQASVREIAQALRLSEGAVRVRLHRGREKLLQILSEQDADPEQSRP